MIKSDEKYRIEAESCSGTIFKLEKLLKQKCRKKYCITFSSATIAFDKVCEALEIKNEAVCISPLTWSGMFYPILVRNNKIIFPELDSNLNLDLDSLAFLTGKYNVKLIVSTDLNGNANSLERINAFCKDNNIFHLADCAESFGAYYNGVFPAGFHSSAVILSFGPNKTFFAGQGGACLTDDYYLYEKLLLLSHHPVRQARDVGFNITPFIINSSINYFGAKYLLRNFKRYEKELHDRQIEYWFIIEKLKEFGSIDISSISEYFYSTYLNGGLILKKDKENCSSLNEALINIDNKFSTYEAKIPLSIKTIPSKYRFNTIISFNENGLNEKIKNFVSIRKGG